MELKSSSILFLTFLVVGLMLSFVSISTEADYVPNNKKFQEAWWEAYDGDKKPEQVYECLKKVLGLYASHNSELSWEDEQRKHLFDDLFNAWNPTPDQCKETDFTTKDHFPQYFLADYNIGDYWLHCERKRIQVCEPVLEEQLKTEVDQIDEAQRQQVKLLVDSVMSECAPPAQPWYRIKKEEERDKVLTAGTLKYLETLEGPLSKSVFKLLGNSEDRFTGVYKRLVSDLCSMVFNTGKKQMKILKVIEKYNESWEPSGLVKQWMQADRICESVVLLAYKSMTFKLLTQTNRGKGIFGLGREV